VKSRLEYHVFASFPPSRCGVRVGVTLTEKNAKRVGDLILSTGLADEVWFRIHERRPSTKPWRMGKLGGPS
jgi:hypothetical protein